MENRTKGGALGFSWIDPLMRDVKQAVRHLSHDWHFTTAAVLILALGIGANTAIFSVVNALLFRSHTFPDPHRIVNLYQNVGERAAPGPVSFPVYRDIVTSSDAFTAVTAVLAEDVKYQAPDGLRTAFVEHATSSYLDVLGYRLPAGRWFAEAEDDRLPAYVQLPRRLIQFLNHARRQVHIHSLNWMHHPALPHEESGYVLPFVRHPRNCLRRNRLFLATSFLHRSSLLFA